MSYPPPSNPSYQPPPPGYYQAPQTNVVVVSSQGAVATKAPVQKQSQTGGFFSHLGKAFDSAANDLSKAASSAAHAVVNPMEMLRNGNKILIEPKACAGKFLRVLENGLLECSTDKGPASQFVVVKPIQGSNVIKLGNVARPSFYISVQNGYTVGYGNGGPECELVPSVLADWSVTFESVKSPGSHIGVLPTGGLTAPAQTNKQTDASHFKITLIGV